MNLKDRILLLTGGTGSFGQAFIKNLLSQKDFNGVIRVFSRDEFKQHEIEERYQNDRRLRFFIGDVRDINRLKRAMDGVDYVIHAAALKQIPILEYNPFEAVKTNILGTQNVIDCAIDFGIKKSLLISSDKACVPVNLYGATKMVAENIFVQGNSYVGGRKVKLSVVRYGNVVASRGSIVPKFLEQAKNNELTITDDRMTRFWITLDQGVKFVLKALEKMEGGEIFVPKLPSIKIIDLAKTIAPNAKIKIVGIRPGEKFHEVLIGEDEARHTRDVGSYFVVEPEFNWWGAQVKNRRGTRLKAGFSYKSNNNSQWLTSSYINKLLRQLTENNV